jgi:translation initiation factor IF-3
VFFRGRSITHPEIGRDMLLKVFEKVKDLSNMEANPRMEGRHMSILLQPR